MNGIFEEIINKEIVKGWVFVKSLLDVTQESRFDDATSSPHQRNSSVVQIPAKFNGGLNSKLQVAYRQQLT